MDPSTSFLIPVYAAYATVSVALTVFLARTLFKNGEVFLEDVFKDTPKMADAVNRLLVVGFYLLNLGYAALIMKATGGDTTIAAVEVLAWKLGALLLSLGFMHFANMYLFYRIRRRARIAVLPPPVAPQMRLTQHRDDSYFAPPQNQGAPVNASMNMNANLNANANANAQAWRPQGA